jgi:7,8-dihydro-6-hydroxymethylpterin-pyrophosphokinase
LPHPRLAERLFALLPAAEIAPTWVHPRRHATLKSLASALPAEDQPCCRIGPFPPLGGPPSRTPGDR